MFVPFWGVVLTEAAPTCLQIAPESCSNSCYTHVPEWVVYPAAGVCLRGVVPEKEAPAEGGTSAGCGR